MSEIAISHAVALQSKASDFRASRKSEISDDHQKCEAFLRCSKTLFRTLVRGVFDSYLLMFEPYELKFRVTKKKYSDSTMLSKP